MAGIYIYGDNPTPQYDAATANWGAEWRMPTKKDMYASYYKPDVHNVYRNQGLTVRPITE